MKVVFYAVCVFVNDVIYKKVVGCLYEFGVKVIVLRCAGFNNVDTKVCYGCGKQKTCSKKHNAKCC